MDHKGNQSNGTRNMKNVNFVPKDVQKIYYHIKFRKSTMNNGGVLQKRLLLNVQEYTCVGACFLIKMQDYRPVTLLKRHSNTGVFLTVTANFLKTTILKNICERLLLRVFPFMFV